MATGTWPRLMWRDDERYVEPGIRNNTLTRLGPLLTNVGTEMMSFLCDLLMDNTSVDELLLQVQCFGDTGAKCLARVLEHNRTIRLVIMERNDIGSEGAKALAAAITHNTSLVWFYFGNYAGIDGAAAFATMLRFNTCLRQLRLEGSGIKAEGVAMLCDALIANKASALTTLMIGDNPMEQRGAEAIARLLRARKPKLVYLDVEDSRLGEEGTRIIAEALATNPPLRFLMMRRNHAGNAGAKHLGNMLSANSTLETLSIGQNDITDYGCLTRGLAQNRTLTKLDLRGGQRVTEEDIASLKASRPGLTVEFHEDQFTY